jgi:membrane protein required for colicin V production
MNGIDIAVVVILLLSTLVGVVRGGLASILSTIGWIIAIIGNHYLFNEIAPFLEAKFDSKLLTFLIGYGGGIMIILFCMSIINFTILSTLSQFRGGFFDRLIGLFFGVARGVLIVVVLFLCFETGMQALSGENNKAEQYPEILLNASALPIMKKSELLLLNYIPSNFKHSITSKVALVNDDQISEITLLNLVRKLSANVPPATLEQMNKNVEENSQYMHKRQILMTKIKTLWTYYEINEKPKEKLSDEEIKKIKSVIG